ncbi:hypothetical protein NEPAR05_2433 [Nematocida parisii]|nr:hypothetical protein NEPAR07_2374 [Nematocida parisii]KAI5159212.1 hypothetical protein NEPAR05_2433 [Nematocida parisii]
MGEYIDEEIKIELQKEFSDKKGKIQDGDIEKIYKILMGINRKTPIFKDLPESLTNLAYNIFYTQIYSRNIECVYNEDTTISKINSSITQISEIIDMIKEEAETLDSKSKKQAFYKLIRDNHMIIAQVYRYRKNFYDSSINILCKKAGISELDEEITSKDAIVKILELTESGECSRLQRVLNILMKHDDNLTTTDKNGEEQSNICDLELTNDDIYSLHLFARTGDSGLLIFTLDIINDLIYNSICVKDNDKKLYSSIWRLYTTIYTMSNMIKGFSLDKDKNKDTIKTCLNQLKNMENIVVGSTKYGVIRLDSYISTLKHKDFNVDKFRNNLVETYLKSIKSDVYGIVGRPIEGITDNGNVAIGTSGAIKKGIYFKAIIIVAVIMIVIAIVLSIIFGLYFNETNKIMNIFNIM